MIERGFGAIMGDADPRDWTYDRVTMGEIPETYLPEVKAEVHDQGQFNNCATHALAAAIEDRLGGRVAFGWYYGNRRYSDHKGQGTIERDLLKAAQKDGGLWWVSYPYEEEMTAAMERFEAEAAGKLPESRKLTTGNYYRLNTYDDVRAALYSGKMVFLCMVLFEGFKGVSKSSPVLPLPSLQDGMYLENILGSHAVWATGHTTKEGARVIRCRNSYGADWGENGDFYVPEDYFLWPQKNGFPMEIVEAWAVDGINTEIQPAEESGWYKRDGKWRYRNEDGKDATGWLKDNGKWYYLDFNGWMVTGWAEVDDEWYYLNGNGQMLTGWLRDYGYWYYLAADGAMQKGWITVNGKTYWLNTERYEGIPTGAMILTDGSGAVQIQKG